jgi:hypothetical protein
VLGLLIATAKGSSDNTDRDVRSYAADLIVLAETLRDYGADAATPTDLLRRFTSQTLHDIWPEDDAAPDLADARAGQTLEHVRESIRALRPVDAGQQWLQDQALTLVTSLLHQRWQLIEHQGPNVRPVVLAILVSWIAVIFASFGLNAPRNATVVAAFLVCSLAIGGSVFLIIEMDNPFQGMLQVPRAPMANALERMQEGSGCESGQSLESAVAFDNRRIMCRPQSRKNFNTEEEGRTTEPRSKGSKRFARSAICTLLRGSPSSSLLPPC